MYERLLTEMALPDSTIKVLKAAVDVMLKE